MKELNLGIIIAVVFIGIGTFLANLNTLLIRKENFELKAKITILETRINKFENKINLKEN